MYHVSHVSPTLSKFMGLRGGSNGPTALVDSFRAMENKIALSFARTQLQLVASHGELARSSDELQQRSTTWAHVYL
jgi:hypothetical protein